MAKPPETETSYEIVCPHCSKQFTAELLSGGADRYRGFKCPHCRLFVAFDRADESDEEADKS